MGKAPHPNIRLPYDVIKHIPLINAGIDVRYSLIMYLAVAVVLAVGLDRLVADGLFAPGEGWRRRLAGPRTATPRARAGLGAALAVIGLVPLVPSLPVRVDVVRGAEHLHRRGVAISNGDVVLSYPLPVGYQNYADDQALLWQAEAGMRFKLIGFRGAVAGPDHKPLVGRRPMAPPDHGRSPARVEPVRPAPRRRCTGRRPRRRSGRSWPATTSTTSPSPRRGRPTGHGDLVLHRRPGPSPGRLPRH